MVYVVSLLLGAKQAEQRDRLLAAFAVGGTSSIENTHNLPLNRVCEIIATSDISVASHSQTATTGSQTIFDGIQTLVLDRPLIG